MTLTVEVRYYTDPACPWSWGTEPKLRKLAWEFDGELAFRWVMGGLARRFGPDYSDDEGGIGSGPDCFADLISQWLTSTAETGMPCDPRIWSQNPLSSTYPACMAMKAAQEQGQDPSGSYLRRLREAVMLERRKLDHAEALLAIAGEAGLDIERFKLDLGSNAITEAFAADLDEVRAIPDEVRQQGAVRHTEGRERLPFPSMLFVGGDGNRHGVWGWQPYDVYREAAIAAGASPTDDSPPDPVAVVERFGRAGTQEVEVLTGLPTPVVSAELWGATKEWKLRPIKVLTGVMWEKA